MGGKPRVIVFDAKPHDREFFDAANRDGIADLVFQEARLTQDTVDLAAGADAVCAFVNDDLSRPVVDALVAHGVRLVALRCAGYNNVDLDATFGRLPVVRVPRYSPHAVAEHAVALILALNRKIHRAYYRTRDGNFALHGLMGFDLAGKTVGIIGTGQIGRIVARILQGFDMEVLLHDPRTDDDFAATLDAHYVAQAEIWERSHVISLHCPLLPQTHHLVDAAAIARMRQGVMIVNTGRGGLIDSTALIDGLRDGGVGSAGLDVYEEEEDYFFQDLSDRPLTDDVLARLLSFTNVIITAHQAFFTREAMVAIAGTTLDNIVDFFAGKPRVNEICYHCDRYPCEKPPDGRCCTAQAATREPLRRSATGDRTGDVDSVPPPAVG